MTQKEELKRDLISREIEELYNYLMANNDAPIEHLHELTDIGCIPLGTKDKAGFALRRYLHRVEKSIKILHRIDTQF